MTNPTPPVVDRHPLARIARTVGTVRAVVAAVLSVPAVVVLVGADVPTAVDAVLGALLGLLATVGPLWSAIAVRRRGEPLVTPVADPRDDAGRPLVARGRSAPL